MSVKSGDRSLELRRGDVFLAPFRTAYTVSAAGPATLYKATVPTAGPSACGQPAYDIRHGLPDRTF